MPRRVTRTERVGSVCRASGDRHRLRHAEARRRRARSRSGAACRTERWRSRALAGRDSSAGYVALIRYSYVSPGTSAGSESNQREPERSPPGRVREHDADRIERAQPSSSSSSARSRAAAARAPTGAAGRPRGLRAGRRATSRANSSSSTVSPGAAGCCASASSSASEAQAGHQLAQREGQALGDGRNVVPLVVVARASASTQTCSSVGVQGHDDERVETGGAQHVGGGTVPGCGAADRDDTTIARAPTANDSLAVTVMRANRW